MNNYYVLAAKSCRTLAEKYLVVSEFELARMNSDEFIVTGPMTQFDAMVLADNWRKDQIVMHTRWSVMRDGYEPIGTFNGTFVNGEKYFIVEKGGYGSLFEGKRDFLVPTVMENYVQLYANNELNKFLSTLYTDLSPEVYTEEEEIPSDPVPNLRQCPVEFPSWMIDVCKEIDKRSAALQKTIDNTVEVKPITPSTNEELFGKVTTYIENNSGRDVAVTKEIEPEEDDTTIVDYNPASYTAVPEVEPASVEKEEVKTGPKQFFEEMKETVAELFPEEEPAEETETVEVLVETLSTPEIPKVMEVPKESEPNKEKRVKPDSLIESDIPFVIDLLNKQKNAIFSGEYTADELNKNSIARKVIGKECPSAVFNTFTGAAGVKVSRDCFELLKEFDGSWYKGIINNMIKNNNKTRIGSKVKFSIDLDKLTDCVFDIADKFRDDDLFANLIKTINDVTYVKVAMEIIVKYIRAYNDCNGFYGYHNIDQVYESLMPTLKPVNTFLMMRSIGYPVLALYNYFPDGNGAFFSRSNHLGRDMFPTSKEFGNTIKIAFDNEINKPKYESNKGLLKEIFDYAAKSTDDCLYTIIISLSDRMSFNDTLVTNCVSLSAEVRTACIGYNKSEVATPVFIRSGKLTEFKDYLKLANFTDKQIETIVNRVKPLTFNNMTKEDKTLINLFTSYRFVTSIWPRHKVPSLAEFVDLLKHDTAKAISNVFEVSHTKAGYAQNVVLGTYPSDEYMVPQKAIDAVVNGDSIINVASEYDVPQRSLLYSLQSKRLVASPFEYSWEEFDPKKVKETMKLVKETNLAACTC